MSMPEDGGGPLGEASIVERQQLVTLTQSTFDVASRWGLTVIEDNVRVLYLNDNLMCYTGSDSVCLAEVDTLQDVDHFAECVLRDDMLFPEAASWREASRWLARAVLWKEGVLPIRRISYRFLRTYDPYHVFNRGAGYYGRSMEPGDPEVELALMDIATPEPDPAGALTLNNLAVQDWMGHLITYRSEHKFPPLPS